MDQLVESDKTKSIEHPLNPLTEEEIYSASRIVKNYFAESREKIFFETIQLEEPEKSFVLNFKEGMQIPRAARVNVFKEGKIGVHVIKVSISEERVISEEKYSNAQPMIQLEEFLDIENAVKTDPRFIKGCERRGIVDLDLVCVDPWSAGFVASEDEKGRHISHIFAWVRNSPTDHQYAHPIEGLNATVDIKTLEVIEVIDVGDIPIPKTPGNYISEFEKNPRDNLKQININQPSGVSFEFKDGKLLWDKWSLVVGFNSREGLTLHNVCYDNRSICYRASIAEMVVPYGSPNKTHARKNVFDIGEYGIGKLANSLELGCDCLGSIYYMDCWIADTSGNPMKIKNGICIHEEDHGLLWKHYDFRLDSTEVRRGRRLVISSISTVGNYDYASYWYLYLDGEIEFEMKATGVINTVGCIPHSGDKYGTEVAPGVVGQIHQHIFCARLDMAVDGEKNSLYQCDTEQETSSELNPFGNAFYVQEKALKVEGGFKRNPEKQRYWKFVSETKKNKMGNNTSYKLEPTGSIASFHDPNGPSGSRMKFIFNSLWVTEFDREERYPAGEFVNGSKSDDGLPSFVKKKRSIKNEDLVAWHVFGLHHLPRLEDYPVQPVVKTGFKLMPVGFFDKNPSIDLAAQKNRASCSVKDS